MPRPNSRKPKGKKYALGLHFGRTSGQAVLVDIGNGREVAVSETEYPGGVITGKLPKAGSSLTPGSAVQWPADFLDALIGAVSGVLKSTRIKPEQVIGIGVACPGSSLIPTRADGKPLCLAARWRKNPHTWVKLSDHATALPEAEKINELGRLRMERFLHAYGGRYSPQGFMAKLLETVNQAPAVYEAAARFLEVGDWIVWQLSGEEHRSAATAGFKAMRVNRKGDDDWAFPDKSFFRVLNRRMENVVAEKLGEIWSPLGACAGTLTPAMAKALGLAAGTPIASATIDFHASMLSCGITGPGKIGISLESPRRHLLVEKRRRDVAGMTGVVENGLLPGFWGYAAEPERSSDGLAVWRNHLDFAADGKTTRPRLVETLESNAAELMPGASGLLALEGWSINPSGLAVGNPSAGIIGLRQDTRPEEILRMLIETEAFRTRRLLEALRREEFPVRELIFHSGSSRTGGFSMQLTADVTGLPVHMTSSPQAPAHGAAMWAAVAAGAFPTFLDASRKMASPVEKTFKPNPRSRKTYDLMFQSQSQLLDLLTQNPVSPWHSLQQLRRQVISGSTKRSSR